MFFALGEIRLRLPAVRTIKERRHALNSFIERARNMNISIVDISGKSELDSAELAYAFAAQSEAVVNRQSERMEAELLKNGEIEIVNFVKNVVVPDGD